MRRDLQAGAGLSGHAPLRTQESEAEIEYQNLIRLVCRSQHPNIVTHKNLETRD